MLKKIINSHNLAIDLNEKYNYKNFYNCINNITNYFKSLFNLLKIVNKCEKKLESNITIEKNIFNIIIEQLNFIVYANFN